MASLPTNSSIAEKIYAHYEKKNAEETPRMYLGASEIGNPCERALWYSFRHAAKKKFDGRLLRLFNTGHRAESRFVDELKSIGCEVHDVDASSGSQIGVTLVNGHFKGHCDGVAKGIPDAPKAWHVLEFKTHNDKSFKALSEKGVRESKPEHVAQMQVYMSGLGIDRALYLAENKNTSEVHAERLESDPVEFERLKTKAERVINAAEPPARINDNPGWYECKFCAFYQICHQKRVPNKNCRTCAHSTAITTEDGGKWGCESHKEYISHELQRKGCCDHVFIPALIQYAKPIDAGNGWIAYKHDANGRVFINLAHEAMPPVKFLEENNAALYTSEELTACDPAMIGDPMIDAVKNEFEGAHVVA